MPLLTSGVWLLGALLSFSSVVRGLDVSPTENFCSLSYHMSRTPSDLLKCSHSLLTDQRAVYIVAQKDGMLYIVGGWMTYPFEYSSYDGPSLCLLLMHNLLLFLLTND